MSPPRCTPGSSVPLPAGVGTCGGRKEAGRTGLCPGPALAPSPIRWGEGSWGCTHPGVGPLVGGRHRGGSGGAARRRPGCPRCAPPAHALSVPRMPTKVWLVAVRVGCGAPGRGSVGVVGHGNAGVVPVPRVRVGLEAGCSMAVVAAWVLTGVCPLVAVGTATPRRRANVSIPRAAAAGWGPVRAARAIPPLVLGLWLSFRVRGRREVHFLLRVVLPMVLLSSSSTVGFAGGVFPAGVGGPWGVGLLLGLRPGDPSSLRRCGAGSASCPCRSQRA